MSTSIPQVLVHSDTPATDAKLAVAAEEKTVSSQESVPVDELQVGSKAKPKQLKITASNGWQVLAKVSATGSRKKRVKREDSGSPALANGGNASGMYTQPTKRAGTRGKLAVLLSLPVDILFEVFGHLAPLDLLRLSRTNKAFRRELLHKSATSLWKESFVKAYRDGAPPCPEDLSLVFWANLLYEPHCHNCLAPGVRSIEWVLRIRLCVKCAKLLLVSEKKFRPWVELDRTVKECLSFEKRERGGTGFCLKKDRDDAFEAIKREPENTAQRDKMKSVVREREEHAKVCREWAERLLEARETELSILRAERQTFIEEHLCALGYEEEFSFLEEVINRPGRNLLMPPIGELKRFYEHEEVKVAKPITERIWNNRVKAIMVSYMEEVKAYRLANDRKTLLNARRNEAASAWTKWLRMESQMKRYPPSAFLPTVQDFVDDASVQSLINAADDVEVFTFETFKPVLDSYHTTIETWQKNQSRKLFDLVDSNTIWALGVWKDHRAWGPPPWDKLDWMEAAVLTFKCTERGGSVHDTVQIIDDPTAPWSRSHYGNKPPTMAGGYDGHAPPTEEEHEPMWFPEFLHHGCCKLRHRTVDEMQNPLYNEYAIVNRLRIDRLSRLTLRRDKWSGAERLVFDDKASDVVKKILKASGLSVKTKVGELDKIDPKLVCLKCTYGGKCDGERRVTVRTWRNSVKHALSVHWGSSSVQFERISDEDAKEARRLETTEYFRRYQKEPRPLVRRFRCLLCRDSRHEEQGLPMAGLIRHIETVHALHSSDVTQPEAEGTIYTKEALGVAPMQPLAVQMVPKAGYPPTVNESESTYY
ncbi:hypothetical protein DFP72DRAFT_902203 [Ephemerocybe angulata]|uniref:F-box domain-containing protein n=1 Tax=Ephemerocybe angulata TaxID=980116 RepID=A0A8H6HU22_9AGAR|nr:hypothetical protein DFP72DRAFT_902203 [Tulosesus angulatus]